MTEQLHFREHDPGWAARFEVLATAIGGVLPAAEVVHVGSTAVPGLAAKDCIDVLVLVPGPELQAATGALGRVGAEYRPASFADDPGRRFLRIVRGGRREAHLHLMEWGHPSAHAMVCVRDLLRADARWRERYAQVKRGAADRHPADRAAYMAEKAGFVAALTDAALRAATSDRTCGDDAVSSAG